MILTSMVALLLVPLLFGWRVVHINGSSYGVTVANLQQQEATGIMSSTIATSSKKNKSKHRKKNMAAMADILADSAINNSSALLIHGESVKDKQMRFSADCQQQQHLQQQHLQGPVSGGDGPESDAAAVATVPANPSPPPSPTFSHDPGAVSAVAGSGGGVGVSEGVVGATQLSGRSYVTEDGAVVIGRLRVGPGILGYGSAGGRKAASD